MRFVATAALVLLLTILCIFITIFIPLVVKIPGVKNQKKIINKVWSGLVLYKVSTSTKAVDVGDNVTDLAHIGAPQTLPLVDPTSTAVTVVYVPYPGDCCPKTCRCKYWCWDAFLRTKLGDKWWTYRCYCKRLVDHRYFESFIIFMIMTSSISLVIIV